MGREFATIAAPTVADASERAGSQIGEEAPRLASPSLAIIIKASAIVAVVDIATLTSFGTTAVLSMQDTGSIVYLRCALVSMLIAVVFAAMAATSAYFGARPLRPVSIQCIHALLLWSVVLGVVYLVAPHGTTELSPAAIVLWFALGSGGIVGSRLLLRNKVQVACHPSRFRTRVALVGSAADTQRLSAFLDRPEQRQRYTVAGIFIDDAVVDSDDDRAFRNADSLPFVIGAMKVDMVIAAPPWTDRAAMNRMCERLRAVPANVYLLTEIDGITPLPLANSRRFAGRIMVELWSLPLATWRAQAKRAEDVVISLLALVLLAPMMAVVAILIRLESPGPVIFRQMRYGFANRPIRVSKFRTMRHDLGDAAGVWATVRDDPRVTAIGRILRRTSLDELPQLFDVLRGDMSLVGPRAHPIEMRVNGLYYADAVNSYAMRHLVKPGITGLAQINGFRGHVDTHFKAEQRIAFDLEYIERWSLGLDLWILWRSAFVGFINENAY